jgi:hypothetical protein
MKLPQLSLRELFLLVVIAAMGCGWWNAQEQLKTQHSQECEWFYDQGVEYGRQIGRDNARPHVIDYQKSKVP